MKVYIVWETVCEGEPFEETVFGVYATLSAAKRDLKCFLKKHNLSYRETSPGLYSCLDNTNRWFQIVVQKVQK